MSSTQPAVITEFQHIVNNHNIIDELLESNDAATIHIGLTTNASIIMIWSLQTMKIIKNANSSYIKPLFLSKHKSKRTTIYKKFNSICENWDDYVRHFKHIHRCIGVLFLRYCFKYILFKIFIYEMVKMFKEPKVSEALDSDYDEFLGCYKNGAYGKQEFIIIADFLKSHYKSGQKRLFSHYNYSKLKALEPKWETIRKKINDFHGMALLAYRLYYKPDLYNDWDQHKGFVLILKFCWYYLYKSQDDFRERFTSIFKIYGEFIDIETICRWLKMPDKEKKFLRNISFKKYDVEFKSDIIHQYFIHTKYKQISLSDDESADLFEICKKMVRQFENNNASKFKLDTKFYDRQTILSDWYYKLIINKLSKLSEDKNILNNDWYESDDELCDIEQNENKNEFEDEYKNNPDNVSQTKKKNDYNYKSDDGQYFHNDKCNDIQKEKMYANKQSNEFDDDEEDDIHWKDIDQFIPRRKSLVINNKKLKKKKRNRTNKGPTCSKKYKLEEDDSENETSCDENEISSDENETSSDENETSSDENETSSDEIPDAYIEPEPVARTLEIAMSGHGMSDEEDDDLDIDEMENKNVDQKKIIDNDNERDDNEQPIFQNDKYNELQKENILDADDEDDSKDIDEVIPRRNSIIINNNKIKKTARNRKKIKKEQNEFYYGENTLIIDDDQDDYKENKKISLTVNNKKRREIKRTKKKNKLKQKRLSHQEFDFEKYEQWKLQSNIIDNNDNNKCKISYDTITKDSSIYTDAESSDNDDNNMSKRHRNNAFNDVEEKSDINSAADKERKKEIKQRHEQRVNEFNLKFVECFRTDINAKSDKMWWTKIKKDANYRDLRNRNPEAIFGDYSNIEISDRYWYKLTKVHENDKAERMKDIELTSRDKKKYKNAMKFR